MNNRWTVETAKRCLAKAVKGQLSLTEAGALDFLRSRGHAAQAEESVVSEVEDN